MKTWKRFVLACLILAPILNAALWLGVYWWLPHDAVALILHYNVYLGPDVFGQWQDLFIVPATGLAIIILNAVLALWLRRQAPFFNILLALASLLVQVILAVGFLLVLSMNRFV